jgi:TonB family protein
VWPELLAPPACRYPEAAATEGIKGSVEVGMVIDERGNVSEAKAKSGPPALRDAAVSCVQKLRYRPATRDGVPFRTPYTITIQFRGQ